MTHIMPSVDQDEGQDKRSISVAEWHQLALNGIKIPIRIKIDGVSMQPLIRMQRDWVTLLPIDSPIHEGDIVLFLAIKTPELFMLHRVWKCMEGAVQTLGDGCVNPDPSLPLDTVLGKATLIERGRLRINPSSFLWRTLGVAWMKLLPIRHVIFFIGRFLKICKQKIFSFLRK